MHNRLKKRNRSTKKLIRSSTYAAKADDHYKNPFSLSLLNLSSVPSVPSTPSPILSPFFIKVFSKSFSPPFALRPYCKEFLVDTGSSISVLPSEYRADFSDHVRCQTASGQMIETLGSRVLNFRLNFKQYTWKFHVADVSHPIIGMDFLSTNCFVIDCKSREITGGSNVNVTDTLISLHTKNNSTYSCNTIIPGDNTNDTNKQFITQLIRQNPNLTTRSADPITNVDAYYHAIVTQDSPPLRERVRPLPNDKLEAVKQEFLTLEKLGTVRRSSSP